MPSLRVLNVRLAVLWLFGSLLMLAGPVYMVWGRWGPLLDGHPLTLVCGVAVLVLGFVGLLWAVGTLVVTPEQSTGPTVGRRIALNLSVALLVLGLITSAGLAWIRPVPAKPAAITALTSTDTVQRVGRLTWYELVPTADTLEAARRSSDSEPNGTSTPPSGSRPGVPDYPVAVVFSPGARIDARGYAATLRPLAEAGVLVIVLKEPFGLALLPDAQVQRILSTHPGVDTWVAAGHSMGGVAAAGMINRHPEFSGLLLWASYPAAPLERPVPVLSISGSTDGQTEPADIGRSKADLPGDARFVEVAGANHAAFGDFGRLRGDGSLVGDRDEIQAKIINQSRRFVLDVSSQR